MAPAGISTSSARPTWRRVRASEIQTSWNTSTSPSPSTPEQIGATATSNAPRPTALSAGSTKTSCETTRRSIATAARVPPCRPPQSPSAAATARQDMIPTAIAKTGTRRWRPASVTSAPGGTTTAAASATVTLAHAIHATNPPTPTGGAPGPISRYPRRAVAPNATKCAARASQGGRPAAGTSLRSELRRPPCRATSNPAAPAPSTAGTSMRSADTSPIAGPVIGKSTSSESARYSMTSRPPVPEEPSSDERRARARGDHRARQRLRRRARITPPPINTIEIAPTTGRRTRESRSAASRP